MILNRLKFLIVICFCISVFANECSTIDLDAPGGSVASIPTYDQGKTQSCYAHTGSVMLDAWLHSRGGDKSKTTSPGAMAIFNKASIQATGLGNISCRAIESTFKYGRCLNEDLTKNLILLFGTEADLTDPDPEQDLQIDLIENLLSVLDTTKEKIDKSRPKSKGKRSNNITYNRKKRAFNKKIKLEAQELACSWRKINPEVNTMNTNIKDIIKAYTQSSDNSFKRKLLQLICGESMSKVSNKDRPKCKTMLRLRFKDSSTPKKFKNKINAMLESPNPVPIGVGYCSGLLDYGIDYRGLKKGFLGFTSIKSMNSSDCGIHESAVIGRKMINGKCHFKIRNSYGDDEHIGLPWESDKGNIWLEADALTNNMGSLTYLE